VKLPKKEHIYIFVWGVSLRSLTLSPILVHLRVCMCICMLVSVRAHEWINSLALAREYVAVCCGVLLCVVVCAESCFVPKFSGNLTDENLPNIDLFFRS